MSKTSASNAYPVWSRLAILASMAAVISLGRSAGCIAQVPSKATGERGVIRGSIRDEDGKAVANARVLVGEQLETRTNHDGLFVLSGVPTGRRRIEVLAIGREPLTLFASVVKGDTVVVSGELKSVTHLEPITVTAATARQRRWAEVEERQAKGIGRFMDSTTIARYATVPQALSMLSPSACLIVIDGVRYKPIDGREAIRLRDPRDFALIEAYRGSLAPMQYRPPGSCYVLILWTKNSLP